MIVAVVKALNPDTLPTSSGPLIKPFLAAARTLHRDRPLAYKAAAYSLGMLG